MTLIYSRGGIGAGDIKLAIAGSGMLSYPTCVPFLLYTGIAGGLLAGTFLAVRANGRATLSRAVLPDPVGNARPDNRQTRKIALRGGFRTRRHFDCPLAELRTIPKDNDLR